MKTAAQLLPTFSARYPAFATLDSGLLMAVLEEAVGNVDDRWIAADQDQAAMSYAAHILSLEGHGGLSVRVGETALAVSGPVDSVQVGDVRTTFSDKSRVAVQIKAGQGPSLLETPYGRRFIELRRRSFPDAVTV